MIAQITSKGTRKDSFRNQYVRQAIPKEKSLQANNNKQLKTNKKLVLGVKCIPL